MTARPSLAPLPRAPRRFHRSEDGAVLIEFALVITLFFLLFYVALDFGRFAYSRVLAQKAADIAVRTAVVRPPACAALDPTLTNQRGPVAADTIPPRFGTSCSAGTDICAAVATVTCTGSTANATANEIWTRISPMLPGDATIGDLGFSYSFDPNLGFLGGPYTPVVTVELTLPDFRFTSPVGPLVAAFSGAAGPGQTAPYGSFSMSLPAEDLNQGEAG